MIGKQGRAVYAYEAKLPPLPTPLLPPDEDVDAGYDPFRSSAPEPEPVAPAPSEEAKMVDLSTVTDWSPVALLQAYFRAQLTRGWFARRSTKSHLALKHTHERFTLDLLLILTPLLRTLWRRNDDFPQRFSRSRSLGDRADLCSELEGCSWST